MLVFAEYPVNRAKFELVSMRVAFVSSMGFLGAMWQPFALPGVGAALFGGAVGLVAVWLGWRLREATLQGLMAGFAGTVAGALLGLLFVYIYTQSSASSGALSQFLRLALPMGGAYVGLAAALAKAEDIELGLAVRKKKANDSAPAKILDTSVLIDGRIVDIAESGFIEGRLVVPRFVLHELQLVADSADSAKRNRGRRGLDVVQLLQKVPGLRIEISTEDYPEVREVDLKLIEQAKSWQAKIITNDFNLNKLAQVQGLSVLNINELANSLKPVVLPGEAMRVFILKEGKEHNQGVAYLDDGTMVVIDNARRMISRTVDIVVTSVLQTTAGKMIFGRFDDRQQTLGEGRTSAAAQ